MARVWLGGALVCLAGVAVADEDMAPKPTPFVVVAVAKVTATSTLVEPRDKMKERYAPYRVLAPVTEEHQAERLELRTVTAWCEGKKDEGIGETLTITFAQPEVIDQLSIGAGVWNGEKLYERNNRPTKLTVIAGDRQIPATAPDDRMEEVVVKIGKPAVTAISIRIDAVTKGKDNDTCLSYVSLSRGDSPLTAAIGMSAEAAAAFRPAQLAVEKAFFDCDAAAIGKLVKFPFKHEYLDDKKYKATYRDAAAMVKACKKQEGGPRMPGRSRGGHQVTTVISPRQIVLSESERTNNEQNRTWSWEWAGGAWRLTDVQ